ncbi:predicted protein [Sclerotinia sclerotiorum 1980 UF-70]|uniref:Uncharacterized protein n=2 Tax=Sclerotinia sclerotiorum (strain ATCC 18683 / 1980 / Ss-1) TaxID=665079 RepID=A7E4P1_SCLS1|nr:predicted protein [Sclerotinia sclerotiorum 1980 UF-70]APA08081.1 hypothetical protein sscle_03g028510 [Sclerotinia sclerotiorum 1980 UF-70]EDN90863.1 predicted protein [Sclerotinia sclerotiorum 1980 UF-70]
MHFSMIASIPLLFLSALTSAAPTAAPAAMEASASSSTQIYYLVNCFNNKSFAAYAEADYYPEKSLSLAGQTPTKTAIFNPTGSIDFEDGTWTVDTPFKLTAVIGEDSYTAKAGTVVGSATVSTSSSKLSCVRLERFVLYSPSAEEQCYTDYACQA